MRFIPTIFLSAFLIFQVQPLVSKHILPWYGGTPAVWTTCLLVFQFLLFFGYAYAHVSVSRLGHGKQLVLHVTLLLLAAFVSVLPGDAWKPEGAGFPIVRIVIMLGATVGLPFFVLASSGPILQTWFARLNPGRSPYHLFAVSNAGSLIALLSYPFVFEPAMSIGTQARLWSFLYIFFVILCGLIAWLVWKRPAVSFESGPTHASEQSAERSPRVDGNTGRFAALSWVAWAACGVILFMSVTTFMTMDIAAVPFLWIVPLSIYLFTFMVTFIGPRGYPRRVFAVLLPVAITLMFLVRSREIDMPIMTQIVLSACALFVCCMVCHGELYRIKPKPAFLTRYYLSIAAGGALGGVLVAVVAPQFFLLFAEMAIGLLLLAMLYLATLSRDMANSVRGVRFRLARVGMAVFLVGMVGAAVVPTTRQMKNTRIAERNFFGLLRIRDAGRADNGPGRHLRLYHGTTLHGTQFVEPKMRRLPTLYYASDTGVGALMQNSRRDEGRRIGVVGMGAATLSAWGEPPDYFRFYEIDPAVVRLAHEEFSYLGDTQSQFDIVMGDARLRLEDEESQQFDILVLDAFSSDAVPVHLLTREAMAVYDRHIKTNGVMAFHVSNHYLNLSPIVFRLAELNECHAIRLSSRPIPGSLSGACTWILVSRNETVLKAVIRASAPLQQENRMMITRGDPDSYRKYSLWTDDFSNLFEVVR